MIISPSAKRSISVVPPENQNGCVEYKRQVHQSSAARLRSLATQMSFRLDQGNGRCMYRIGVEDDGCHSLLDYGSIAESARVLECLARSLNSVVVERKMIQNEIVRDDEGNLVKLLHHVVTRDSDNDNHNNDDTDNDEEEEEEGLLHNNNKKIIIVREPPVFGIEAPSLHDDDDDDGRRGGGGGPTLNDHDRDNVVTEQQPPPLPQLTSLLTKEPGFFTRAEIIIQRVETHLLDPSPISFTALTMEGGGTTTTTFPPATTETTMTQGGGKEEPRLHGNTEVAAPSSSNPQQPPPTTTSSSSSTTEQDGSSNNENDNDACSITETLSARNIRVAVVGNVDAGKSTLIGTLTTSMLDDGRGKSRTSIMKHRHEITSGRTSTATTHLMGFRSNGQALTAKDPIRANKRKTEDEVVRESHRIITLMDLAGHEKYLKTTIHGVSSGMADYALILVNSRHPPTHMTQHHLNLCCSFGIPVIVLFTKIDGCPDHALKTSKQEVMKLLRSPEVGKKPFTVRNEQDVSTCMGKLHTLAPIIETSCVTGEGMELLQQMLFCLPKRRRHENKVNRPFEFLVEDLFFNVPGVGVVVSGFVNAGALHNIGANCHVYVGPTDDGSFLKTVAKSAHVARINTTSITSGQSACLAFALNKELRKKLRRGMVVLQADSSSTSTQSPPTSTREFDAEICVLKGEGTTIRRSYQAYVHILNVRQSAFARKIEIVNHHALGLPPSHSAAAAREDGEDGGIVLRPGSRAKVRFEFAQRPEYIRPGMRMLFRDGRVRGVGIITSIPKVQAVK